jgi:hypothetical protein
MVPTSVLLRASRANRIADSRHGRSGSLPTATACAATAAFPGSGRGVAERDDPRHQWAASSAPPFAVADNETCIINPHV